jgi:hypothetical protein
VELAILVGNPVFGFEVLGLAAQVRDTSAR